VQGGGEQHSLGQGEQSGGEANPEQCGGVNKKGKLEPVQGWGEQHSHGQGGGETNQEQCGGVNERGSGGRGEQHNSGQGGMTRNEQSEDGVTGQRCIKYFPFCEPEKGSKVFCQ
jgi:hypothetical protein